MKTRASSWTIPYATVARAADAREGSGAVEPRLSLVTLAVSDLRRAVAFYRDGLGWPKCDVGGDEVAFFKTGGAIIGAAIVELQLSGWSAKAIAGYLIMH